MFISSGILSIIGLITLYNVSPELFSRQFYAVVIGIIAFIFMRRVDTILLQRFWWFWYGVSFFLLLLTYFFPEVRGSHRWLLIFGQGIQSSEIVKPLIILAFAGFISMRKNYNILQFSLYSVLFIIPFLLVLKQPDLGNGIIYLFIYLALLFVSNFPLKYYITPILTIAAAGPLLWPFLESYQKLRITTFLNPSYDIQGAGYNSYQSLIAVGSGGIFGKGLGAGTQSTLAFLPEYHTDFIFATTIEQIGLVGGTLIILIYAYLLVSILLCSNKDTMFVRLVVWGLFAQLLIQILINIGMNTGIVPITGITLPLLSYGGSSILATFVSLGIISSFRDRTGKKNIIAIR